MNEEIYNRSRLFRLFHSRFVDLKFSPASRIDEARFLTTQLLKKSGGDKESFLIRLHV